MSCRHRCRRSRHHRCRFRRLRPPTHMQVPAGSRETAREQPLARRLGSSGAASGSTATSSVTANAQAVAAACEAAVATLAALAAFGRHRPCVQREESDRRGLRGRRLLQMAAYGRCDP